MLLIEVKEFMLIQSVSCICKLTDLTEVASLTTGRVLVARATFELFDRLNFKLGLAILELNRISCFHTF